MKNKITANNMKSILKITLLLLLPFFGISQSNQKLDSLHFGY